MRELADSGVHLEGTEKSHCADDHHEILHFDGNQKSPEDLAVGEHHGVDHQNAKNSARAPDGRDVRIAPRQNVVSDNYADTGAHRTKEVEPEKALSPPDAFQFGAEHPERQHVPDDVPKATM